MDFRVERARLRDWGLSGIFPVAGFTQFSSIRLHILLWYKQRRFSDMGRYGVFPFPIVKPLSQHISSSLTDSMTGDYGKITLSGTPGIVFKSGNRDQSGA